MPLFIIFFTLISFFLFAALRLRTFLHYFQQEEYDNKRFIAWLIQQRAFDKKFTLGVLFILIFSLFFSAIKSLIFLLLGAFTLWRAWSEYQQGKRQKKKLVFTPRAMRIYGVGLFLFTLMGAGLFFTVHFDLMEINFLILIQFIPLLLPLSNWLLSPYESHIQKSFIQKAKARLREIKPTIIAITGSYGKTSTKHILGHILAAHAPTLITPGSVNTMMGISRIILEKLDKKHRYFIVEMGAYGPGSIKRLCDFVDPDHGIITCIGEAHLERFKSKKTILKTKYELVDYIAKKKGMMLVDAVSTPSVYLEEKRKQNSNLIPFGCPPYPHIKALKQTKEGLSFSYNKTKFTLPIYGSYHADNACSALLMCEKLGLTLPFIQAALKTLPQIRHRSEIIKNPGAPLLIDNAYNSNEKSFRENLMLLNKLTPKEGESYLVTPGLVEMGKRHDELHNALGKLASRLADHILLICPERIQAFVKACDKTAHKIHFFSNFQQAKNYLNQHATSKDAILLENDLPDLYERRLDI